MENNVEKVIQSVKNVNNPTIKAKNLSFYLSDCLKLNKLSIYEAYLLQWEIINYSRNGYILPAWNGRVQISTCLAILNEKLLALVFNDKNCEKKLEDWGKEALSLCCERRTHYIMDRYIDFLHIRDNDTSLLRELLNVRENYATMSDDDGPYHVEVFPYHYFQPERILLEKMDIDKGKNISTEIETILIELNV